MVALILSTWLLLLPSPLVSAVRTRTELNGIRCNAPSS